MHPAAAAVIVVAAAAAAVVVVAAAVTAAAGIVRLERSSLRACFHCSGFIRPWVDLVDSKEGLASANRSGGARIMK